MSYTFFSSVMAAGLMATVVPAICQEASNNRSAPLYRVTVVERSVDAVNYQYHAGPTNIDFRGTVLLAKGKGEATVESRRGRTEIDARFSNLAPPARFGREYLAYVFWAISPEGAPRNLGEIVPDASDHGHLRVTTDLQVFGLIVTSEPYSAVRQPSDVVVLENVVRADTIGHIEPIQAKYELLPRGQYTYTPQEGGPPAQGAKVSMSRYESLLQIYQAQNAVQIARAQGADKYATDTLAKAEHLLAEARQMEQRHAGRSSVVTLAREAAQTAEDARAITMRHKDDAQQPTRAARTVNSSFATIGFTELQVRKHLR